MTMETKKCPLCPERGAQEIDKFGICRARKDGRNLYCMKCINKKIGDHRTALREYKAKQKARKAERLESGKAAPGQPPVQVHIPGVSVFANNVVLAILNGATTRGEIENAIRKAKQMPPKTHRPTAQALICNALAELTLGDACYLLMDGPVRNERFAIAPVAVDAIAPTLRPQPLPVPAKPRVPAICFYQLAQRAWSHYFTAQYLGFGAFSQK